MKHAATFLFAVLVCASAAALLTSRLHWGYWIVRPSEDFVVSTLTSVERYTDFLCCEPARSGSDTLTEVAKFESRIHGDMPVGNLPAALARRHLTPTSPAAVSADVLKGVCTALQANGVLVDGQSGYSHARELWGHIAVGRDRTGASTAIAGLFSGAVSNDHHVYYEAAFSMSPPGEFRLLKWHRYYYDVAGLEGLAHWLAAVGGGMAGAILWAAVSVVSNARRPA